MPKRMAAPQRQRCWRNLTKRRPRPKPWVCINAGHDLNRYNLRDFVQTVQGVQEVSIGHALIADALELGYAATIEAYLACLR